jgi:hypothetical protein
LNLTPQQRRDLLISLAQLEGFDTLENLIEQAVFDSVSPAICINPGCHYTTEMEPDQDQGYCEVCGTNTVQSALILAGMV